MFCYLNFYLNALCLLFCIRAETEGLALGPSRQVGTCPSFLEHVQNAGATPGEDGKGLSSKEIGGAWGL
jgi:hypothetical protein